MLRFIVTYPDGRKTEFICDGQTALIGRAPSINDICLEDPSISRQHAQLKRRKDRLIIKDLSSQNGVTVDGKRVQQAELRQGETVSLGNIIVQIYVQDYAVKLEHPTSVSSTNPPPLKRSGLENPMAEEMTVTTLGDVSKPPTQKSQSKKSK